MIVIELYIDRRVSYPLINQWKSKSMRYAAKYIYFINFDYMTLLFIK